VGEDASTVAEGQERNAWQADAAVDRAILIGLLATSALAILAAFTRRRVAAIGAGSAQALWRG